MVFPVAVSIHAPVWGATGGITSARENERSFNPRTRVGCDLISPLWHTTISVSIHAPVWGATQSRIAVIVLWVFQSTHPCGVRQGRIEHLQQDLVSIHAPVWGATSCD